MSPSQNSSEAEQDLHILASGASISFVGRMINAATVAILQIFLARWLGEALFGLYAVGWTVIKIGSLIGTIGLHQGVIRFGARYWPNRLGEVRRVLRTSLMGSGVLSVLLALGLFLGAESIATALFRNPSLTPVLRIVAFAIPFAALLRVGGAATRISQKMKYGALAEDISRPTSNLLFVLVLSIVGLSLSNTLIATVISFAIGLLVVGYFILQLFGGKADQSEPPNRDPILPSLLIFSIPAFLAGLSGVLILRADRLFLAFFLGPADVGVYQAASQSAVVFAMIIGAFNAIFAPMIADLYHRHQHERLNELFKMSTKWGLYLSLPVFLVFAVYAEDILRVVFGPAYVRGASAFTILSFSQVINVATGAVGSILLMTGRQNQWLIIAGTMVGVNFLSNVLLIPRFGIEGAATATAITMIGLLIPGLAYVRHSLKLWPYDRRYWKGGIAALVTLIPLLVMSGILVAPGLVLILLVAVLAAGTFASSLLLLGLESEDRELLRIIQRQALRLRR